MPKKSRWSRKEMADSVDDVGRTMPAKYLAVGQHTIPYALRVEQIASHGLPDLIADTAEAQPPGHFGVDSPLRPEIDDMLVRAAHYIQSQEAP
jgi:hypothetical protein